MGAIRALATLLPPCGGNTLRHAGYVLTALRAYARRKAAYWHKANTPLLPAPIIAPGDLDKCPTKDRILVTKKREL